MIAREERRRLVLVADEQLIIVRGPGSAVACLRPTYKPIYVGASCRGFVMDRYRRGYDRLGDVLARLQQAGHAVRLGKITDPDPEPAVVPSAPTVRAEPRPASHPVEVGEHEGQWLLW